jgi:arsenite-transporting ATPase
MRIIVHTGKGGVGKTSISAATALRCAEMGLKTIVISTDTAHSLADSLEVELGPEPTQLRDNLWGQEVDVRYSMDKHWWRFQEYMMSVFTQRDVERIVAEEVTILPGLEEGAQLLWVNQYFEEGFYDALIVDAAPTAETLRLLSFPDVSRWWFERLMAVARGTARFLRPFSKQLMGTELPPQAELDAVEQLFDTLERVGQLLSDPKISAVRLITTPERMPIKETQRTYTYLNLYGYPTDGVICNRIIPDEVIDDYFSTWKRLQQENMELIREAFGQLKLLKAPLFEKDIGGLDDLRRLADAIYGDRNPIDQLSDVLSAHRIELDEETGNYLLKIPLPFAEKRDLDVYRSADELTIRVGQYRRNIVLPKGLWRMEIAEASFVESALQIRFINKEPVPGEQGNNNRKTVHD